MHPQKLLPYKESSLRDFKWPISGGIEPLNWFSARCKTLRLISRPIWGGIFPEKLLKDRSRYMSLDRQLISIGTVWKSSFMLRSTNERLGSDENENSWRVPFKPEPVRFNLIILPAWLQETPNQLHGFELAFWLLEELVALLLGRRVHEGRSDRFLFWRLAFQRRRAFVSVSLST